MLQILPFVLRRDQIVLRSYSKSKLELGVQLEWNFAN